MSDVLAPDMEFIVYVLSCITFMWESQIFAFNDVLLGKCNMLYLQVLV
jgi:hypothetical protein